MVTQTSQSKQETNDAATPLERLASLLDDDMRAVNAAILNYMDSGVPMIPQLAGYLIGSGGKRIRPLMTLASTALCGGEMARAHKLAASVEFIHTATLLHDDVVDESIRRRGKDAANVVFGNQASVLVGDFLFSRAFQLMVGDGALDVLRILSDASAIIAEGEVMQLAMTGDLGMDFETYEKVISAKTAALFAASCEIGPVIAGADKATVNAMRDYGLYLGLAFQIVDDVLDYTADQNTLGKTIGDDFREGKITAPVLFALAQADEEERAFWERVMVKRDQSEDDLAMALTLIKRHDAFARSLHIAQTYGNRAIAALDSLSPGTIKNDAIGAALKDMVDFTIRRAS